MNKSDGLFRLLAVLMCVISLRVTATARISCAPVTVDGITYSYHSKDEAGYIVDEWASVKDCDSNVTEANILPQVTFLKKTYLGTGSLISEQEVTLDVRSIGDRAFDCSHNIISVTIPPTVEELNSLTFVGCENLKKIVIADGDQMLEGRYDDGYVIINGQKALPPRIEEIYIGRPLSYEIILNLPPYVDIRDIARIEYGGGATSLINMSFCKKLKDIVITAPIETIPLEYFTNVPGFTEITIPAHVKSVWGWGRDHDKYASTPQVNELGDVLNPYTGLYEKPTDITHIICEGKVPPIFNDTPDDYLDYEYPTRATVSVPFGTKEQYIKNGWDTPGIMIEQLDSPDAMDVTFHDPAGYLINKVDLQAVPRYRSIKLTGVVGTRDLSVIARMGNLETLDLSEAVYTENEIKDGWIDWSNVRPTTLLLFKNTTTLNGGIPDGCRTLILPNGLQRITTFDNRSIESLTIPESVSTIDAPNSSVYDPRNAFRGCGLKSIYISGNLITHIPADCFSGCNRLEMINIPSSVTSIGDNAFEGCFSLPEITIPNSVVSIGKEAFKDCKRLSGVTIPTSVTDIGHGAFSNCSSLTQVSIQHQVKMGSGVFSNCISLTNMTLYVEGDWIPSGLFNGCVNLKNIDLKYNRYLNIGVAAFEGCSGLENFDFSNIGEINDGAFRGCSSLKSVDIKTSPKHFSLSCMGVEAFSGCSDLTHFTLSGDRIISFYKGVFKNCTSLKHVEIPASVSGIGNEVFSGCSSLKDIIVGRYIPWNEYEITDVSPNAFDEEAYTNATLYVPGDAAYRAYWLHPVWSKFLKMSSDVDEVGEDANMITVNGGEIENPYNALITVYNMTGRTVYSGRDSRIDTLSDGIYIICSNGKTRKIRLH